MFKVLLVDDMEILRLELKRLSIWERFDFEIAAEASDGADALELLLEKNFDLVITDIRMPVVDGLELLSEIKSQNLCACTILLSEHNDFSYAKKGISQGAFDYLLKPVDIEELQSVLARAAAHLYCIREEQQGKHALLNLLQEQLGTIYSSKVIENTATGIIEAKKESNAEVNQVMGSLLSTCGSNRELAATMLQKFYADTLKLIYIRCPWLLMLVEEEALSLQNSREEEDLNSLKEKAILKLEMLSDIFRKYTFRECNQVVKMICDYVLGNLESELTVAIIGDKLNFNKDYLSHLFKTTTGKSITEYITGVKMDRASLLLTSGRYKIYEVSDQLGYKDTEYFSRLFKKCTGFYPKELLRKNNELEKAR